MIYPKDSLHEKPTVLITGASSGIGFELAKIFASHDYNLILVSKDRKRLNFAADEISRRYNHTYIKAISKDLSNVSAVYELYKELKEHEIQVDVLVNNAGYTLYGKFSEIDVHAEHSMLELNMVSLTILTKLFLKGMLERKKGRILNLSSTAAFQPGPLMATYYASKSYVLSFSEALASELNGTGVTVTCLCPGPTKSNFQKKGEISNIKLIKNKKLLTAETVAKVGYDSLMAGKGVVVVGFRNKLLAGSTKFVSRRFASNLVKKLHSQKN